MKKKVPKLIQGDEMRDEYDFKGAVRGKHYKPMHEGYSCVHPSRGWRHPSPSLCIKPKAQCCCIQMFVSIFPDSDAVNSALRSVIALMQAMPNELVEKKERKRA